MRTKAPFGWKVRIVLAEKKVPHEVLVPENKSESVAFGKLNPFRLTPVLELEDGRTIYESTVINEYLEEAYPTPAMLPRDPYERARIRMLEDTTDQYLYPVIRDLRSAQFARYRFPAKCRNGPVGRAPAHSLTVHDGTLIRNASEGRPGQIPRLRFRLVRNGPSRAGSAMNQAERREEPYRRMRLLRKELRFG